MCEFCMEADTTQQFCAMQNFRGTSYIYFITEFFGEIIKYSLDSLALQ